MNFQSPDDVRAAISAIFPQFEAEWGTDNPSRVDGGYSVHTVYRVFLEFLVPRAHTEKQLGKVAVLINGAVLAGGDSENAVSTCFLEHLHQVGLVSALKPFLGKEAKARLHV